ncbi:GNAT family N-acetyltransferase [Clostridium botulinum]|uniref:GNAT family N-acetyltransferase n=1 Tax=Clostridium botulinum TaxID=1491 RepID=UPI00196778D3|nr:GNAT family N-acetyltransferase [Clostridium botulinum]
MIEIIEENKKTNIKAVKENQIINFELEINEFDTQHFGIIMANLNENHTIDISKFEIDDIEKIFEVVIKQCKIKRINHIALKTATKDYKIIHAAEKKGFVLENVSMEYAFDYSVEKIRDITSLCKIRESTKDDLKTVLAISKDTFKNFSRFHYDENLSNQKADELYEKWIINSFKGYADKILVAENNGEVVGFCTLKNNFVNIQGEKACGAILAGVSPNARGLGVYKAMINEAIKLGSKLSNVRYIASSTQAQNVFVQRAWSELGLKIYCCKYIFHKIL